MEIRMMEARILGDYTIIKQIGQGSMGTVYLAEHRFMKQQCIIKVLPEELASDRSFIQRFEEDVALLSTLEHPHITRIHNISFSQGQYFLVLDCIVDEFGETTNLAQYLLAKGRKLEEDVLFHLLRQVASALDYAHQKKISHRGLKLNNILIGKGSNGGVDLSLTDFGLSRIVGSGAILTRSLKNVAEALSIGGVMTPPSKSGLERYPVPPIDVQKLIPLHASFLQNYAFLSPEQKRLDSNKNLDMKCDTYAFGVLAYYLLVGEFPEGLFEMPSSKVANKWNWDLLIQECLQADPAKRASQLVALIDSIQEVKKTIAEPLTPTRSFSEPVEEPKEARFDLSKTTSLQESNARKEQLEASISQPLRPIIQMAQLDRPIIDPDPAAIFQIDTNVKQYVPEQKEERNIQPLSTEMAVIKGGNFMRGSSDGSRDELPRHQIYLPSFAIDVHPITNEQFTRFLEAMGGEKDNNHQDIIRMRDSRIKRTGGRLSIESGYAKHPVVGVTWYGAVAYAKWVGKRLPTEAEWEIAARGGLENAFYPTGEEIEKTQANFFSSDTTAVMSYGPNPYGLYDMAGNVYEWCHDWYGYNYYEVSIQEPENPKGPLQGVYRVLRGGCWKSLKEDLRCSRRHRNNPGTVNGTYGFRCATDVQ